MSIIKQALMGAAGPATKVLFAKDAEASGVDVVAMKLKLDTGGQHIAEMTAGDSGTSITPA